MSIGVVAFGVACRSGQRELLSIDQALGGFGDPTVMFIASLFVVSEALDSTGVTAWAGQLLIAGAGESRTRLALLMLTVAVLTALISVNGSVAALRRRDRRPPADVALAVPAAARVPRV